MERKIIGRGKYGSSKKYLAMNAKENNSIVSFIRTMDENTGLMDSSRIKTNTLTHPWLPPCIKIKINNIE